MSHRTAGADRFAWVPRFAVMHVMKTYPRLTACGFSSGQSPDFDADRAEMLTDAFLREVDLAENLLRCYRKTKTVSHLQTSYGLKHRAERYALETGADRGDCYVSNGAMIVAAVVEGFVIKRVGRSSPNAFLNISTRPCKDNLYADSSRFRELDNLPCEPLVAAGDNIIPFPMRGA